MNIKLIEEAKTSLDLSVPTALTHDEMLDAELRLVELVLRTQGSELSEEQIQDYINTYKKALFRFV